MTRYKQLAVEHFAIGEGVAKAFEALGLNFLHVTDAIFGMYGLTFHTPPDGDDYPSTPDQWSLLARMKQAIGFHAMAGAQAYLNRSLEANGEAPLKRGKPSRKWVYLVSQSDYECWINLGVFSSLERAEAYTEAVDRLGGGSVGISEFEVDVVQPPTKGWWDATLTPDGTIIEFKTCCIMEWTDRPSVLFWCEADEWGAHIVAADETEARQVLARLVARAHADPTLSGYWEIYDT